jgi:hypothetical protein
MKQLIASLLFEAFNVIAVANLFHAGIHRPVIIDQVATTRILAIITAIIAPAGSRAIAFRIQTFAFLFDHPTLLGKSVFSFQFSVFSSR